MDIDSISFKCPQCKRNIRIGFNPTIEDTEFDNGLILTCYNCDTIIKINRDKNKPSYFL